MADSKLKRLYQENNTSGFAGNILKSENFNEIIEEILMTNAISGDLTLNTIDFGNGVKAVLTKDTTSGEITSIQLEARIKTQFTPFDIDTTGTIYSNPDIKLVDGASSYAVYRPDGTLVDSIAYTLGSDGKITFGQVQTNKFLMVEGLVYIVKTLISITRGTDNEISSFSVANNN